MIPYCDLAEPLNAGRNLWRFEKTVYMLKKFIDYFNELITNYSHAF
jgi:hypothetical protein